MVDARSRARVERMIAGDFRPDDLTHLFLYARDRCDGRESVQEIGDFAAHHAERTKGIITRSTRDWFAIAHFAVWQFANPNLDIRRLPAFFLNFLWATFRRIDLKTLRAESGLSHEKATKLLKSAIRKFSQDNNTGSYSLTDVLTQCEHSLLNLLVTRIIVKGAFTGDRLCDDFIATLRSNGVLSSAEIARAVSLRPAIQLFAVSIMHNCTVVMEDGSRVSLQATPSGGRIAVIATIPVPNSVRFASEMYSTDLPADQWCESELMALGDPWQREIELKQSGKLGLM